MNPLAALLAAIGADAATLAELQPLGQSILSLYESLALANAGAGLNLRFYRAAAEMFPQLAQSAIVSAYRYVGYLQDPGVILQQIDPTSSVYPLMFRELPPPSRGLPTGINARYGVEVTIHDPTSGETNTAYRWIYGYSYDELDDLMEEAETSVLAGGSYEGRYWPMASDESKLELSARIVDAVLFA